MATLTATQLARAAAEGDSLANFLLPAIYWPEDGLFIGTDGRLTAMWEVVPANCQDMDDASLTDLSETLARSLSDIPTGGIAQALIFPSRRLDDQIKAFRAVSAPKPGRPVEDVPLLKDFQDAVVGQMLRGAREPLLSSGDYDFTVKVYRVIVSATVFPDEPIGFPFQITDGLHRLLPILKPKPSYKGLSAAEDRFLKQYNQTAAVAKDLRDRLERSLKSVRCETRAMDGQDYQRVVRELIYPITGHRTPINTDPDCLLYQEVPIAPIRVDLRAGTITTDGSVLRVASFKDAPKFSDPGHLTLPNRNLGGATVLDYLGDGFLSIAAMTKPRNAMRRLMEVNLGRIRRGFVMPGRTEIAERHYSLAQQYVETGRRLLSTTLTAVVRGRTPDDAETRIKRLAQYITEAGVPMQVEQGLGPSLWIHALPGNAFPPIAGSKRDKLLPDRQVADLFPVFYHSRGSTNPHVMLFNRAGEPFPNSPFGGANANGALSGKSGSGKSVTLNYVVLSLLCVCGAQAFIIDKGKSYIQLCEEFGPHGQFVDLGGSRCTINPFSGTYEDASQFLETLLIHLATPTGGRMDEDDLGLLNRTLQEVYFSNCTSADWTDFDRLIDDHPSKYIGHAYKRLSASYVEERIQRNLDMHQSRNAELYSWRIWYVLKCRGLRISGGDLQPYHGLSAVNEADLDFVISQRGQWEESSDHRVHILVPRPDMVDTMTRHGFDVELDRDICRIDLATDDELSALEKGGVEFKVPAPIRLQVGEDARAEILGGGASIPESRVEEMVRTKVAALAARRYLRETVGTAKVQSPIFFSMLGQRLEDLARDESSDDGKRAARLVSRLRTYWGTGAKAGFFDGPTSFDLAKCKLAVFELDNLSSSGEHLMSAVLAALMHEISVYCKDPRNRWRLKFVPIDEGWSLVKYKTCAQAIEESYRTIRKFGGANWICTQSIGDAVKYEPIRDLLALSPNKWLLRQEKEDAQRTDQLLGFTPAQRDLVVGLTGQPGLFSEILIYAPDQGVVDVGVLILPPLLYWLFTTNPEDRATLDQKTIEFSRQGHDYEESRRRARRWCAEQYPHGSFRR